MRSTIRVLLCICLMAIAVTMAAFTMAGFAKEAPAPGEALRLGAWQGSVAVFDGSAGDAPVRVTEIALASLRATDRALIEHGYPVGSEEELQALLEDLGS